MLMNIKRIGKIAYGIRLSQAIILDHSMFHSRINFVPGADPYIIKEMVEYGFINLIYVNGDCRELEMLPKKSKKVSSILKGYPRQNKQFFCQILHCLS